jgi:4-hydroxybenzoate polyprenyltransferase
VRPGVAVGLAGGLTVIGVALAGLTGGRRALAVAVPLAATVWVYDVWAKNTRGGPAVMAACRGLDVLMGATPGTLRPAVVPALTVAAHTWTVTVLSRREVDGAAATLPVMTLAGTAAVAGAAVMPRSRAARRGRLLPTALAGWYAATYGRAQGRAAAEPTAGRIRAAVGAGITSLPALQGALTANAGSPVAGLAVFAAAPLGGRLAKRLSPT